MDVKFLSLVDRNFRYDVYVSLILCIMFVMFNSGIYFFKKICFWRKVEEADSFFWKTFLYKRLGDIIQIASTFAIAALGTLETTTFLCTLLRKHLSANNQIFSFIHIFRKNHYLLKLQQQYLHLLMRLNAAYVNVSNVSVTTLSVLAIFLSCFRYFKMTKIKSVVPAKLRIIDLSVVTTLVALMQILAIANLQFSNNSMRRV